MRPNTLTLLAVLAGFGLAGAPDSSFSPISPAWADDDDDDDGPSRSGGRENDDDDDGPGIVLAPPLAAPEARPEILTFDLSDADLAFLQAQGFVLLETQAMSSLGATLRRFAPSPVLGLPAARDLVRNLPSGTGADFNHFYRPGQGPAQGAAFCQGAHCPSFAQIGWTPPQGSCGPEIRIGMVDSGVNAAHAAFGRARMTVHRIGAAEGVPSDPQHGTSVAALLAGDPAGQTPGLAPELPLVAVDAFRSVGGDERTDAFVLIQALDLLAGAGARVANLSLSGPPNAILEHALTRFVQERGLVILAAAGNVGPYAAPVWPAAHPEVIAVTAVDVRGGVYRRAGRGAHIDLSAPGVGIWTAAASGGGRAQTGTSFAVPFATAAAARLLQSQPHLTPPEIARMLASAATDLGAPGRDPVFGAGLLLMPPCAPQAAPRHVWPVAQ